ncbi:MAG TPA: hypothetical protein VFF78_08210, partial [Anaerolineaceae bacterium]|nr:hypothetical protein [Anaerolineaceae bacterium]
YQATAGGHAKQGVAYVFIWSGAAWVQQTKLTPASGAANLYFGTSVALSSDGNTALIGATGYNFSYSFQGGAYVFTRSGTSWSQQGTYPLMAYDAALNDWMGNTVALSDDGNTALVGASGKASNKGAAYAFRRSGTSWSFQYKMAAWDGAAGDDFGRSVSLSADGNLALIGADNANVNGHAVQGTAYTYTRSGTTWSNGTKLVSSDGAAGDVFGYSVSLSSDGSTAVIGAPQATVNTVLTEGAAYVFSGAGFVQQQKLVATAGENYLVGSAVSTDGDGSFLILGAPNLTIGQTHQGGVYPFIRYVVPWWEQYTLNHSSGMANDGLGTSLAISEDGNTAVIGSTNMNMAFIYGRPNGVWEIQVPVISNDPNSNNFGGSVAISGDGNTVLVGSWSATDGVHNNLGAAYLITHTEMGGWGAPVKIVAPDGLANDQFGISVALSKDGNTAAIGAHGANSSEGAVYVMTRSGGIWSALTRLEATDGAASAVFGVSLALNANGSTLLVGAFNASNGTTNTGAAYVFTRSAGVYTQQTKFAPTSSYSSNMFGLAVALSSDGNLALVGAPYAGAGEVSGQAYAYVRSAEIWSLQTTFSAPDNRPWDQFGYGVGLSSDGSTAVVGASHAFAYGVPFQGAAYVYSHSGTTWTPTGKLFSSDAVSGDGNADTVAISGDAHTILFNANNKGSGRGGVYFFSDIPNYPVFLPVISR